MVIGMRALSLILMLPASLAWAEPLVTVHRAEDGLIRVVADDRIAASPQLVFETLTDFDRLAQFIPDMHTSRIVSVEPLRVLQEGETGFLAYRFPLSTTMEIDIEPLYRVKFRAVAGNMRDMEGAYLLETHGEITHLHYETQFRPDFWVPALIGPAIMQYEITRQFEGLAAEIMRRNASVAAVVH